jgi:hypothetical protein
MGDIFLITDLTGYADYTDKLFILINPIALLLIINYPLLINFLDCFR